MKVKVSELSGVALDWAVAKCEGLKWVENEYGFPVYRFSTDWSQAGPIIEHEGISVEFSGIKNYGWNASVKHKDTYLSCYLKIAETPLIAAMRCYVASKYGDEIEIPSELAS